MLYVFSKNVKTNFPEIHDSFTTFFSQDTMYLWQKGFLKMDVTQKNPMVSLTPDALDDEKIKMLDPNLKYTLKEIIRILQEK